MTISLHRGDLPHLHCVRPASSADAEAKSPPAGPGDPVTEPSLLADVPEPVPTVSVPAVKRPFSTGTTSSGGALLVLLRLAIGTWRVNQLAREGARVAICGRRKERLEQAATRHTVRWHWVKGHVGHDLEGADLERATELVDDERSAVRNGDAATDPSYPRSAVEATVVGLDIVVVGAQVGRIRAINNERGQQLQTAGPSDWSPTPRMGRCTSRNRRSCG